MNNLRHWFIQKPVSHNCPINQGKGVQHEAAVFTEFMPTQVLQNCEWIKVYSADDYEQLKKENEELKSLFSVQLDMLEQNKQMSAEIEQLKSDLRTSDLNRQSLWADSLKLVDENALLKSKLKVAVESLTEITGQHSDLCQAMKPVRPSYVCHAEIAEQALKEIES